MFFSSHAIFHTLGQYKGLFIACHIYLIAYTIDVYWTTYVTVHRLISIRDICFSFNSCVDITFNCTVYFSYNLSNSFSLIVSHSTFKMQQFIKEKIVADVELLLLC